VKWGHRWQHLPDKTDKAADPVSATG